MTVEVLLSCMNCKNDAEVMALVKRTNIKGKAVVINQCSYDNIVHVDNIKIVHTTERGLSRSRNMAIHHATGDICLICDDDEILDNDYEEKIISGYHQFPNADLIAFEIKRDDKKPYANNAIKIGFKQILKTSSVQITFKQASAKLNNIVFDTMLGSGSGNGAGEENKFMLDFRKRHLKLFYIPTQIGHLIPDTASQWFNGYNITYFKNHGWSTRRILGPWLSLIYITYFILTKYSLYKSQISMIKAYNMEIKGWRTIK